MRTRCAGSNEESSALKSIVRSTRPFQRFTKSCNAASSPVMTTSSFATKSAAWPSSSVTRATGRGPVPSMPSICDTAGSSVSSSVKLGAAGGSPAATVTSSTSLASPSDTVTLTT